MTGPTRRDLEQRVAGLREGDNHENLSIAGLITILANEHNTGSFEWIDRNRCIVLIGRHICMIDLDNPY